MAEHVLRRYDLDSLGLGSFETRLRNPKSLGRPLNESLSGRPLNGSLTLTYSWRLASSLEGHETIDNKQKLCFARLLRNYFKVCVGTPFD